MLSTLVTRPNRRPGFRLTFDGSPLHGLKSTSALSGVRIRYSSRLTQVRTPDLPRAKRIPAPRNL
jgi:hypothetical protein